MNIIPKYEQFYREHRHERLLFFQGGKRSGKKEIEELAIKFFSK